MPQPLLTTARTRLAFHGSSRSCTTRMAALAVVVMAGRATCRHPCCADDRLVGVGRLVAPAPDGHRGVTVMAAGASPVVHPEGTSFLSITSRGSCRLLTSR